MFNTRKTAWCCDNIGSSAVCVNGKGIVEYVFSFVVEGQGK